MVILGILYLFVACFFLIAYCTAGIPLPNDHGECPADRDKPPLELPDFARTDDKDLRLREELAALLRTRGELERVFRLGVLFPLAIRFDDIGKVHEYWLSLADREKNVYAAALAAALCRLRPKDMPAGTADSRQEGILARLAEGERHFLLGLSYLRLYEPFLFQARNTALAAWRQAIGHFRRSAAAGHAEGMEAAFLLARIGHDMPFTPPARLPKALHADDPQLETRYWCHRLAETGGGFAAFMLGTHYLQRKTPDMARAEHWLRRAMETGEHRAARILFENYRDGNFPDITGKNAALSLIFLTCHAEKENAKGAAEPAPDERMRRLIAAFREEGTAFYHSVMERRRRTLDAAKERSQCCLAQAAERLPTLCGAAAAAGSGTPGRQQEPRPPRGAEPSHGEPRRSFAPPDKR